jgi:hypothetical protein
MTITSRFAALLLFASSLMSVSMASTRTEMPTTIANDPTLPPCMPTQNCVPVQSQY